MIAPGFTAGGDAKVRILEATDIVELIGRTVVLKKQGKEYVGLCPFHQEKSPSFYVSQTKQFFLCRGCKKGGNAIDFVMLRDRVEFKDALRMLADAAGIELPAFSSARENAGERQSLFNANAAACLFFEKLLSHPQFGQAARAYLDQRGFNADAVKRFGIGFAPDSWDALLKSATMKQFPPTLLALAGLVKNRERGDGFYDTFRNRLMFPIRDESGRVIAFGGRVMPNSQDPAKYLNSSETALFSKGRCVFGLDQARNKIVESRTVAVVEGYTDVVMAHQCGATNVVSVLGTALTPNHVTVLRRLADRIVLLFDADTAGDAAVDRALELFLTQPVEIAIASLPDGVDPDEFLLQNGPDAFNRILAEATDALTFKWKQLSRQIKVAGDSLTARQKAIQDYLQALAAARGSGPVDSLRWGAALARVSRLTEIPVEDLNRRFRKKGPANKVAQNRQTQVAPPVEPKTIASGAPPTACRKAEGYILGLLLLEPHRWDKLSQQLQPAHFRDGELRRIAELFWQRQQDDGPQVFNEFLTLVDDAELKNLAVGCVDEASEAHDPESALAGSLQHLLDRDRRDEEQKLMAQLRRTSVQTPQSQGEFSADIETLRKLQEKAQQPDLKRVGI
jgi:DNA primase